MKRSTLLLSILWLPSVGWSQISAWQFFVVGDHYLVDKCEVQYYRNFAELFFYPNNKFVMTPAIKGPTKNDTPSNKQMGKYKIEKGVLYLNFTKAGYELTIDTLIRTRDTVILNGKDRVLMKPMKFLITFCGDKIILRSNSKEFPFGSRNIAKERTIFEDMRRDKYWAKIRSELEKE